MYSLGVGVISSSGRSEEWSLCAAVNGGSSAPAALLGVWGSMCCVSCQLTASFTHTHTHTHAHCCAVLTLSTKHSAIAAA